MTGLCHKKYLKLTPPTEEDSRSAQVRILDELSDITDPVQFSMKALRQLSLCLCKRRLGNYSFFKLGRLQMADYQSGNR